MITTVPDDGDGSQIPFIGLVEATVVQAFRQTGLPFQRIRRALGVLADEGELPARSGVASALLRRRRGALRLCPYRGRQAVGLLTVVVNGQRVFHDVIDDYLRRIDFEDDRGPRH